MNPGRPGDTVDPPTAPGAGPLLTLAEAELLLAAREAGASTAICSLDLRRSTTTVDLHASVWTWRANAYPYPESCKERTVYHWDQSTFRPVARYSGSLVKLVPTDWGPPTFEIDGIKMLPTSRTSPYEDAERKVALIQPRGKVILDTCAGLGYFAACCLKQGAAHVRSFEKNADVLWLRTINPWSPTAGVGLTLLPLDVTLAIGELGDGSVDGVLHDPPRFGIAGELYSRAFYEEIARVLGRRGRLFHYTGNPNRHGSGRDVPREVMNRLEEAGFTTEKVGDGVLGVKRPSGVKRRAGVTRSADR